MDWHAEPYWQWWDAQMALMAPEPAPDPERQQVAETVARLLRGQVRQDHGQQLGALRHGKKRWNWRR